jgi:L-alanine-DL-glutamate epimerase-like enolase superfamily enzyme
MLSDIRVREIQVFYTPCVARTPLKFGAVVVEALDFATVRAVVENRRGETAEGWGGIFVMDFWGWPDAALTHEAKSAAMKEVQAGFCDLVLEHGGWGHPISLFHEVEPGLRDLNLAVCAGAGLSPAQPFLSALVCASPVDAAIHDAFGNVNGVDVYQAYGAEFMAQDLSTWLGPEFRGRYPGEFVRPAYRPRVPVFHLCGGLDKLRRSELDDSDPQDGLPNCLEDWVAFEGLTCLKVKLRGNDVAWDVARTVEVYDIGRAELDRLGDADLHITVDTNEQCESPQYMVEVLRRVREERPACYDAILYVEQPTERDLQAHRHDMRELSALKPVIVDESLTSVEDFAAAMELGWSGIALKSCKCQSADALFWSLASARGIPFSVQDLTNPSLSLMHSVGLGARLDTIMGVEANSRQFFPQVTQEAEKAVHGGIFRLRDGQADTLSLQGTGLGYQMDRMRALGWVTRQRGG